MNISRDKIMLFVILAVLVFYPLAFVGFTTNDDAHLSFIVKQYGGLFPAAYSQAAGLGRFMVMVTFPIAQIPYLFDNQLWLFAVKMFGFFLLLGAVYWAAVRVFKNSAFGLLILALIMIILQNGWNHDLFTSYPLIFNFYAACFFSSVALFAAALKDNCVRRAYLAAIFYFFSMGTEIFVAYAFVFPLLAICLNVEDSKGTVAMLQARFLMLLPLAAALSTYLLIYVVWRKYYAASHLYDGNSFSGASAVGFFKVIFIYGVNGFPILPLKSLAANFSEVYRQSAFLLVAPLIQALVAAALILEAVRKPMLTGLGFIYLRRSLGVTVVCLFLVNLFLAFTSKYQAWVEGGSSSFTYTFYSMIFAAIASALVLAMVSRASVMQKTAGRRIVLSFIGVLVFVVAGSVGINNQAYFQDQALSNRKWSLFDTVIKSDQFRGIPDGAVIYSPSLVSHQRGIVQALAPFWTAYVKAKIGKSVKFQTDGCEMGKPCYFLSFTQDLYRDEQYMVLAQVQPSARTVAKEFTFYALPNMGGRVLNGFFSEAVVYSPALNLNKFPVEGGDFGKMFSVRLPVEGGSVTRVGVGSEVSIFLDQLIVALDSQPLPIAPVKIRLSKGFYQTEILNAENWTWSSEVASLEVENFRSDSLSLVLSGEASSIHDHDHLDFSVAAHSFHGIDLVNDRWTKFEMQLELPRGVKKIELKGNKAAIRPSNGDTRLLSFRIRNLKLKLKKNGEKQ
jgi:hypothetical protein